MLWPYSASKFIVNADFESQVVQNNLVINIIIKLPNRKIRANNWLFLKRLQKVSFVVLCFVVTATLVLGQRPSFAGSRPIGFPDIPNRTTTVGLGNRLVSMISVPLTYFL